MLKLLVRAMIRTRQREAIEAVLLEAGRPLTRDEILALGRHKISSPDGFLVLIMP